MRFPPLIRRLHSATLVLACALLPAHAETAPGKKPESGKPAAATTAAATTAQDIRASAPIRDFKLPLFTDAGLRQSLMIAREGRVLSPDHIIVFDMQLTLFTEDAANKPETTITSSLAEAFVKDQTVQGERGVNIVRTDFQASGSDWSYNHKEQHIFINRDAHLVFQAEITNILK
ncbi:Protein of unknown function (DUF1239) [Opitutaceae bacterium TAV1]|nr:Protein of unknown function (DUF1239) [Opitutaceae bacterium TAV1]